MTQPLVFHRLEGAILFLAAVSFYLLNSLSIVWFIVLLFSFDISMLGYIKSPRLGAWTYNAGHALILPVIVGLIGLTTKNALIFGLALIWLAHIGIDRAAGYGLKYPDSFHHTSLGMIGNTKHSPH